MGEILQQQLENSRLTPIEFSHRDKNGQQYWKYRCICGQICTKDKSNVDRGRTKSCGCLLLGNTFRRKPLTIEEIPPEFRGCIKLNTGVQPIGRRCREMFSLVKCWSCDQWKSQRNQRIRKALRERGYLYACPKHSRKRI